MTFFKGKFQRWYAKFSDQYTYTHTYSQNCMTKMHDRMAYRNAFTRNLKLKGALKLINNYLNYRKKKNQYLY